jgi:hypothetical protein
MTIVALKSNRLKNLFLLLVFTLLSTGFSKQQQKLFPRVLVIGDSISCRSFAEEYLKGKTDISENSSDTKRAIGNAMGELYFEKICGIELGAEPLFSRNRAYNKKGEVTKEIISIVVRMGDV